MSTSSQNNDNQELDLSQISKKIGNFFDGISTRIYKLILFFVRNIVWVGLLFFLGIALGFYLDKTTNVYDSQVIVSPNYGSNDYLYSKIELLDSKIKSRDTVFLKSIGVRNSEKLLKIEVEPIIDIYRFIDNKATNFDLIKLMAEDGEINKIVKDNMTSKNYPFHSIKLTTQKSLPSTDIIVPILNYLNDSDYYKIVQKEYLNSVRIKMTQNDTIIKQINGVLGNIINDTGKSKSNSLVYYNDNMQLNDIIKTKDALIAEQGEHRMELITSDKIIKDLSIINNIKNTSGTNGKMKFVLPLLFVLMFILIRIFVVFYKTESAKAKK